MELAWTPVGYTCHLLRCCTVWCCRVDAVAVGNDGQCTRNVAHLVQDAQTESTSPVHWQSCTLHRTSHSCICCTHVFHFPRIRTILTVKWSMLCGRMSFEISELHDWVHLYEVLCFRHWSYDTWWYRNADITTITTTTTIVTGCF